MARGYRRVSSLGEPNDFAKCVVGRPLARFSWRQGSIPLNSWLECTVHSIFEYAKHVVPCENTDVVFVEPRRPKTDPDKLACFGDLHRERDFPYLESERGQSSRLYAGWALHSEWCDLPHVFDHRKHESAPDLQPSAAARWAVDGIRQ